jgi:plasmid stabilization system protein ParE
VPHRIRFEDHVEADLVEASFWHDRQRSGLGDRFLSAVFETLDRVAEMPLAYPSARGETRRALVRDFRYSVYFRVDGDDVAILAVIHNSRDPRRWQDRR